MSFTSEDWYQLLVRIFSTNSKMGDLKILWFFKTNVWALVLNIHSNLRINPHIYIFFYGKWNVSDCKLILFYEFIITKNTCIFCQQSTMLWAWNALTVFSYWFINILLINQCSLFLWDVTQPNTTINSHLHLQKITRKCNLNK